ncbi:hypothetical protein SDC9_143160 [bioreactor metagenome]|uniref:Uncharacterized protein n=1 Tax=bioreactor metagenome TaxID=1076179 RepID=A0A645E2I4_9ZZZZ
MPHVLDQRLHRGETGARCQQDDGLVGIFTQVEAAERAFHAQDFPFLHGAEHVIGEAAAGHVADVQFHAGCLFLEVRGRGHGVGAACAVAQDELDVLARVVLEVIRCRQLQFHLHDIVRQPRERGDPHRQLFDGESALVGDLARLQHHVGQRAGAAGQHESGLFFGGGKCFLRMFLVHYGATEFLAFARSAGAVLAAVGQADAAANGGVENGFVALGGEGATAGLNADGEVGRGGLLARHVAGILGVLVYLCLFNQSARSLTAGA